MFDHYFIEWFNNSHDILLLKRDMDRKRSSANGTHELKRGPYRSPKEPCIASILSCNQWYDSVCLWQEPNYSKNIFLLISHISGMIQRNNNSSKDFLIFFITQAT